jgi:hypothetical protein
MNCKHEYTHAKVKSKTHKALSQGFLDNYKIVCDEEEKIIIYCTKCGEIKE